MTLPACTGAESDFENFILSWRSPEREGSIMYHQLCVLGIPLGGERKVDRVPANFFSVTKTGWGYLL